MPNTSVYIPDNNKVFIIDRFALSVKNNKTIGYKKGKPYIRHTNKQLSYMKEIKSLLEIQYKMRNRYEPPEPVYCHIVYGFKKKTKRDFPNITQGVFDAMTSVGILKDDDYTKIIPVYYNPYIGIDFIFISFEFLDLSEFTKYIMEIKKSGR